MIGTVSVYEVGDTHPGARWLVDRIWPRGVSKASLALAGWAQDAAPSTALRRWFRHDPQRFDQFRVRYLRELNAARQAWRPLVQAALAGDVLLLYAAADPVHNHAVVLADHLRHQVAAARAESSGEAAGDPVCWLHLVCDGCGQLPDDPAASRCPRCGATLVM